MVNGVRDEMIPVRNSYWLSENLPNAVLLTYPDAGQVRCSSSTTPSRARPQHFSRPILRSRPIESRPGRESPKEPPNAKEAEAQAQAHLRLTALYAEEGEAIRLVHFQRTTLS